MTASRALYRKYRPTKLSDVVGQSGVTSTLENSLKQGKISHAYLFIGPRGTGKTSVARILAHAINDFEYQVEDSYLDIIEIDAASNTGVDNIRELREKSVIAPTKGKYKVYIIDEIHMLTKSAANALLKTLEEPPEHVVFIMATTDAHKVPITISSRAQVHTFQLASPDIMQKHLRKIADQEGIKITDDALAIVVQRGGGSFRDSLSLLDQIATLTSDEITAEILNAALGLPEQALIERLLTAYTEQDQGTMTNLIHDLLNSGLQPEIITSELVAAIMAKPTPALLPLLARLPEVKPPFPEAKFLLAFLGDPVAPSSIQTAVPQPQVASTPLAASKTPQNPEIPAKKPAEKAQKTPISLVEPPVSPGTASSKKVPSDPTPAEKTLKTPKNTPETTPEAPQTGDFSWESFQSAIQDANSAVASQLAKTRFKVSGSCLHLYPQQKFTKNILEKPGNRDLLMSFLPSGFTLQIHDLGSEPASKDATLSQISDIMGNIQEVNGDLPF